MLQNILKLNGAQKLSKENQKEISGGRLQCTALNGVPTGVCQQYGLQCGEAECQIDPNNSL